MLKRVEKARLEDFPTGMKTWSQFLTLQAPLPAWTSISVAAHPHRGDIQTAAQRRLPRLSWAGGLPGHSRCRIWCLEHP